MFAAFLPPFAPFEAVTRNSKAVKPIEVFICKFRSEWIDNVHCIMYNFNYT